MRQLVAGVLLDEQRDEVTNRAVIESSMGRPDRFFDLSRSDPGKLLD